jgi:hypothetical protein
MAASNVCTGPSIKSARGSPGKSVNELSFAWDIAAGLAFGLESAMPTNPPPAGVRVSAVQAARRGLISQGILTLAVVALGLCGLIGVVSVGILGSIAPDAHGPLPLPRSNQYHGEYNPAEIYKRYAR